MTLLVDFARIGFVQISLNSAARESVRASSFELSISEITSIAKSASGDAARMSQIKSGAVVTVTQVRSCSASTTLGRTTEVEVSTDFDWITPVELMNIVTKKGSSVINMNLKARGVMVCGS